MAPAGNRTRVFSSFCHYWQEFGFIFWNKPVDTTFDQPEPPEGEVKYMRQVDLLEPVNIADQLPKLDLYLSQVCAVAGISKMQLDYWTTKAEIPTKGNKQRVYDMHSVEMVMLIKQAKDKGLNLGAAIAAAREYQDLKDEKRLAS